MTLLKPLSLGPMGNLIYLVGDSASKQCAVVDPGWEADAILKAAGEEGCRVVAILLTHHHFDHAGAVPDILKAESVPVYVHREDAEAFQSLGKGLKKVKDGDTMKIGAVEVEFLHTPGHTRGSQCLRIESHLLTGDTLFVGACGRVDLPDSDPGKMYESLRRLAGLPGNLTIWPGHGYGGDSTLLSREVESNPYLRLAREGRESFFEGIG